MLRLSASRIKTLQNCSMLYYLSYVLKFPNSSNQGSQRGSAVHSVLECLLSPRRHHLIEQLISDVKSSPSINRLLLKHATKLGVADDENMDLMYKFIHTGLKTDFLMSEFELQGAEYAFEIGDPEIDGYKAIGFIDKHGVNHETKEVKIQDYKSSKVKYPTAELTSNVQALMYSLAAHKKYPEYNSFVEFIFLKYVKQPLQKVNYSKQQILGFEKYLQDIYAFLQDFDFERAKNDMARFEMKRKWLCGPSKLPGEMKEDGVTPVFNCAYKFPFDYYAIVDEDSQNTRTAYSLEELNLKDGEKYLKKRYNGCAAWFN